LICAKKVKSGVGAEGLDRDLMTEIIQDLCQWLRQNVVMADALMSLYYAYPNFPDYFRHLSYGASPEYFGWTCVFG
jgi:hypothetical protein